MVRHRGESVKTAANYTNAAQHTNVKISEKNKNKIVHFSPTLLRGFPS